MYYHIVFHPRDAARHPEGWWRTYPLFPARTGKRWQVFGQGQVRGGWMWTSGPIGEVLVRWPAGAQRLGEPVHHGVADGTNDAKHLIALLVAQRRGEVPARVRLKVNAVDRDLE